MLTCPPGRQRAQCQASPQVEPKSLKSSGFPAPNPGGKCHHNYVPPSALGSKNQGAPK